MGRQRARAWALRHSTQLSALMNGGRVGRHRLPSAHVRGQLEETAVHGRLALIPSTMIE